MRAPVPPCANASAGFPCLLVVVCAILKCTTAIPITQTPKNAIKNADGGPRANPTPRWALHLLSIWSICFGVSKSHLAHPFTIFSICRRRARVGACTAVGSKADLVSTTPLRSRLSPLVPCLATFALFPHPPVCRLCTAAVRCPRNRDAQRHQYVGAWEGVAPVCRCVRQTAASHCTRM